jgi:benzil reductase ((S)-benzoin forming)
VPRVIVWITGASAGIGAALAATAPFDDVEIVNVSRRAVPGMENVTADLSDPAQWDLVKADFRRRLDGFDGELALLIQNAMHQAWGFAGEVDEAEYVRQALANAAAPLVLGDAFIRAVSPRFESGIVMITSGGASFVTPGASVYCAAKACAEQWLRVVVAERTLRKAGPWLIALRPPQVDTPGARVLASTDPNDFPASPQIKWLVEAGRASDAHLVAASMWAMIVARPESGAILSVAAP